MLSTSFSVLCFGGILSPEYSSLTSVCGLMEASDADLYLAASSLASSSSKPAEGFVLLRITFGKIS
jgi:hypothetical protein